MFEKMEMAPRDAILGLTEAYDRNPSREKINLGVGVYKNADGRTPIFKCVKLAEEALLEQQATKSYLYIEGTAGFGECVRKLVFGVDHEIVGSGLVATAQTPGGTGGLRVAGDFIRKMLPGAKVWVSDPTWANHKNIFGAAGLEVCSYPYYDREKKKLAFDEMLAALGKVPAGDIVLFHACCHNPCGMDPSPDQWRKLAELTAKRKVLPLFDFAYQGLGDGLDEDAVGLRMFVEPGRDILVVSSFSKNFGLYNERVGALTVVGETADATQRAFGHVRACIRANYSNPPAHGSAIVTKVLTDPQLYRQWVNEVAVMRNRINGMREMFVSSLVAKGVKQDFSFILSQRGMFSFSGLTREQVSILREKYAIYIVGSGRINMAGMTQHNMNRLCEAIAHVLE